MFSMIPWRTRTSGGALAPRTDDFRRMREEFETLFDRFFGPLSAPFGGEDWTGDWGLDVKEEEKALVLKADAPGFEAGDFEVNVAGNQLTIKAERKQEGEVESERHLYRTLTLPAGIEADKVEAHYRNGVLELRLPRSKEAIGKKIEVKA